MQGGLVGDQPGLIPQDSAALAHELGQHAAGRAHVFAHRPAHLARDEDRVKASRITDTRPVAVPAISSRILARRLSFITDTVLYFRAKGRASEVVWAVTVTVRVSVAPLSCQAWSV